ncbi:MAG TPA: helix-hairpin-helix domain-containing protein [Gemmatimonadales bacterium]|jgi:competence protein ComEA|nr:helix-hairpin-helix domain-containing protein [Gemmatimonadales bacterium]
MNREPRAILLLLSLAVAGHAARLLLRPAGPPGELLASNQSPAIDPARQRARGERAVRPLGPGERIDVNSASAEEIARLPRVGMSLAKRIVSDRVARGPFRGLAELDRVPGVGPALLRTLSERVSFGAFGAGQSGPGNGAANNRMSGTYAEQPQASPVAPVDLNSALEADLVALPGIGPARARAILAYRRENGPFAAVSDLGRVPGFSQRLVARLTPLLVAR